MKKLAGLVLAAGLIVTAAVLLLRARDAPDGGQHIVERDGLVTIHIKDMPRAQLLELLSSKLGFELHTAGSPDQRVAGVHSTPIRPGAERSRGRARSVDSEPPRDGPAPADGEFLGDFAMAHLNLPDPVRHEQAELRRIAQNEAKRAAALAALDSEDSQVRMEAIEFVEPVKDGLAKLARQAQQDPEETNRVQAIEQLAKGQGVEITNALVGALQDPAPEVVLSALDAIRSSQDYTLVERVKGALEKRTEPQIQEQLRQTLKTLTDSTPTWSGTDYMDRRVMVMASAPNPPAD
jgi:hypothetical protein